MALACALILAAVGVRRTKLQLLQPIAGLIDNPLLEAWASGADRTPATTPAAPSDNAVSAIDSFFSRGRTGPPHDSLRRMETCPTADERWDACSSPGGNKYETVDEVSCQYLLPGDRYLIVKEFNWTRPNMIYDGT